MFPQFALKQTAVAANAEYAMQKLETTNRLLFHLETLEIDDARWADIWDQTTGARVLHISVRPDGWLILNDYSECRWGEEIAYPTGSADKLSITVSLTGQGAIQIDSNLFDSICFLSRTHLSDTSQLDFDHDPNFVILRQSIPAWDEVGKPCRTKAPIELPMTAGLGLDRQANSVLIVGSAPSVADHVDRIRAFEGDVWALNDALFWMEDHDIQADALFVNDGRFLKKREDDLKRFTDLRVVSLQTVDTTPIAQMNGHVSRLKVMGRVGFDDTPGQVYHGCSVFITAIQCAAALKYRSIDIAGVMFPPPMHYARVDNTKTLPEYVYPYQIASTQLAMRALRQRAVRVETYEPNSNLMFL